LDLLKKFEVIESEKYSVEIFDKNEKIYQGLLPYSHTFGNVSVGTELIYVNSLLNLALAVNQGNFALKNHIKSGADWRIEISKLEKPAA
jgi:S-adenosylmethionine hydrolase